MSRRVLVHDELAIVSVFSIFRVIIHLFSHLIVLSNYKRGGQDTDRYSKETNPTIDQLYDLIFDQI